MPWIAILLFIAFLATLSAREFFFAMKTPSHVPERGIGIFHGVILLFCVAAILYGTRILYLHMNTLATIVPLYPSARYAPEREAFEAKGVWVFASLDTSAAIRDYYASSSERLGYQFSEDHSDRMKRLLLVRAPVRMFVTIEDEGTFRVIYYSEAGEVRTVAVP